MKIQSLSVSGSCIALLLSLLAGVSPAAAAGIVGAKVDGDTLEAKVRLPLGLGADLAVGFEQSVGLTPSNLGLAASLLDSADLPALQSRLPGALVSVPSGFPVLLTIEPPAGGGLSFSGVASIELYTHELVYVPGSPLRLFAAPLGGAFHDITATNSSGSYRVRGHKGDFSELVIVVDTRPVDTVIAAKFTRLDGDLTGYGSAIAPAVYAQLVTLLDEADTAYQSNDLVTAIAKVEAFADAVESASGTGVPDVWRSARDLTNVAGKLRAGASTLRFSLTLKANGGT
jgi:hypothetical protein